jgi:hypothetical protein
MRRESLKHDPPGRLDLHYARYRRGFLSDDAGMAGVNSVQQIDGVSFIPLLRGAAGR